VLVQDTAAYTAEAISLIAWSERRSEHGGLVWGRVYASDGGPVVWVAAVTPAVGRGSEVHFEIDAISYTVGRKMLRELGFAEDMEELGMWHSHPGLGAFASSVDQEYFDLCFPRTFAVSLVVDPLGGDWAVYMRLPNGVERVPAYLHHERSLGPVPLLDPRRAWASVRNMGMIRDE